MRINVTKAEAAIAVDVLSMLLNDPDWQQLASATDSEWQSLMDLHAKLIGAAR